MVWTSLSLRNAFSTLKSSLRAFKSARPWKSSFHSGICSTNDTGWIITHLHRYLSYLVLLFFASGELVQIMMATANESLSAKFCNRVLKFFTKLFQLSKSTFSNIYLNQEKLSQGQYVLQMAWFQWNMPFEGRVKSLPSLRGLYQKYVVPSFHQANSCVKFLAWP